MQFFFKYNIQAEVTRHPEAPFREWLLHNLLILTWSFVVQRAFEKCFLSVLLERIEICIAHANRIFSFLYSVRSWVMKVLLYNVVLQVFLVLCLWIVFSRMLQTLASSRWFYWDCNEPLRLFALLLSKRSRDTTAPRREQHLPESQKSQPRLV